MLSAVLVSLLVHPAQASCSAIQDLKAKVYTFRPSALSDKERDAKSKEMDDFWNLVESRKTDGAACLRQLLADEKGETFFLYDGAALLARLDRSEPSLRLVVSSIARAPLADVEGGAYVNLAIALGRENADISPLAVRFLAHPDDKLSAPQHAMTVDRMFGVLLLFGSLPVDRADAALIQALESGETRVRDSAAMALAVLMTEAGWKALGSSPRVKDLSAAARGYVDRVRTLAGFKPPDGKPVFTREQVVEHLRLLPQTEAEHRAAAEREEKYQSQLPASAGIDARLRHMENGPAFTSLAGHKAFIESAAVTLTPEDLPALREWRRKAVRGFSDETLSDFMAFTAIVTSVIGRFNLYAEYRVRKDPQSGSIGRPVTSSATLHAVPIR